MVERKKTAQATLGKKRREKLYRKYIRNCVLSVLSAILLFIVVAKWLIGNLALGSCGDGDSLCINSNADATVVYFVLYFPFVLILVIILIISATKSFSAKSELGFEFDKMKKAEKRTVAAKKKNKEYFDKYL